MHKSVVLETMMLALKEKPEAVKGKEVKCWTYNGDLARTKQVCELNAWAK